MNKLIIAALLGGTTLIAQPAFALELDDAIAPCAMSDIGLAAGSCVGFFKGNFANASTTDEQTDALDLLGLTFPDAFANKIEKIEDGARVTDSFLNFDTVLYGITYIGVHWGNVPDGVGGKVNNITSFYKFDAGTEGLDKLFLAFKTASNATVYVTGDVPPPPAVPEPATWALMLGGLGIVGAAMRRRVTSVQFG